MTSRKTSRRSAANTLASAGVLQTGDIILSFRPGLADTMAYPHIQMGITHAGMIVVDESGQAFNVDSPLDSEYLGQLDAKHYAGHINDDGEVEGGTEALHVIRPRVLDDQRRDQLRDWVALLQANLSEIRGTRGQLKFQSDYLTPAYVANETTPRQMVTTVGKIILEIDTNTKSPMYCSEFAWHMLALSNCSFDEIINAPHEGAACVDPAFEPMALLPTSNDEVGIGEGPLKALLHLPADEQPGLVSSIFAEGNADGLSSGHRAVAESVAPLMGPLSQWYSARAAGVPASDLATAATQLGANFAANYSPTAYFISAMDGELERTADYVATLAFVDEAGYLKAAALSQLPVP